MVGPVGVVVCIVAGVMLVGVAMVSAVASVAAVVPAVMTPMPAAVTAASQNLRDAETQHKRQDEAVSESSFHRSFLKTDLGKRRSCVAVSQD